MAVKEPVNALQVEECNRISNNNSEMELIDFLICRMLNSFSLSINHRMHSKFVEDMAVLQLLNCFGELLNDKVHAGIQRGTRAEN